MRGLFLVPVITAFNVEVWLDGSPTSTLIGLDYSVTRDVASGVILSSRVGPFNVPIDTLHRTRTLQEIDQALVKRRLSFSKISLSSTSRLSDGPSSYPALFLKRKLHSIFPKTEWIEADWSGTKVCRLSSPADAAVELIRPAASDSEPWILNRLYCSRDVSIADFPRISIRSLTSAASCPELALQLKSFLDLNSLCIDLMEIHPRHSISKVVASLELIDYPYISIATRAKLPYTMPEGALHPTLHLVNQITTGLPIASLSSSTLPSHGLDALAPGRQPSRFKFLLHQDLGLNEESCVLLADEHALVMRRWFPQSPTPWYAMEANCQGTHVDLYGEKSWVIETHEEGQNVMPAGLSSPGMESPSLTYLSQRYLFTGGCSTLTLSRITLAPMERYLESICTDPTFARTARRAIPQEHQDHVQSFDSLGVKPTVYLRPAAKEEPMQSETACFRSAKRKRTQSDQEQPLPEAAASVSMNPSSSVRQPPFHTGVRITLDPGAIMFHDGIRAKFDYIGDFKKIGESPWKKQYVSVPGALAYMYRYRQVQSWTETEFSYSRGNDVILSASLDEGVIHAVHLNCFGTRGFLIGSKLLKVQQMVTERVPAAQFPLMSLCSDQDGRMAFYSRKPVADLVVSNGVPSQAD